MVQLGMVQISGGRSSFFSTPVSGQFQLNGQAPWLAGPMLGQTAQDYYVRAKAAIAQFDQLLARTARIANQTAREQIVKDFGLNDPANKDLAQYMRNALAGDVADADKYAPVSYEEGFPNHGPSRGRVSKLESFNSDFQSAVKYAEETYGILPEPVVITKTVTVAGQTNWVLPVAVGAGALGIAWLFGAFK